MAYNAENPDPADIAWLQRSAGMSESEARDYVVSRGGDLSDSDRADAKAERESDATREENLADMEQLFALSADYGKQLIEANTEATKELTQFNIDTYPTIGKTARTEAVTATTQLNQFMQEQFEASLDSVNPGWRENMTGAAVDAQEDSIALTKRFEEQVLPEYIASVDRQSAQAMANNEAMLRGEINPDVAAQLQRQNAELYQQIGVRGQAANYLTARDFGLTSMQLQQQGLANAQVAMGIAPMGYAQANQTLQAPVTTGMQATNLLNAYRSPLVDPSALYQQGLGIMSGMGMINPTNAYSTNAQTFSNSGSLVQNQQQFSREREDASYWNSMNYDAQQRAYSDARGQQNFMNNMGLVNTGLNTVLTGAAVF